PGTGEPRLGLAEAAAGRPAVLGRTPGEGPLPPAGGPRLDAYAVHARGGTPGDDRAAGGHPGLLPGPLPGPVRLRGGRRELGLGHLRRRPRVARPGTDDGAAARDEGARGS